MTLSVGVDIGGTKVAAGVVDQDGQVVERVVRPTPSNDGAALLTEVVAAIRELAASHPVETVGLGVAGFVDARRTTLRFAPNLPWHDQPLVPLLEKELGLRVVVENDGNAAAWGEFVFGAGRDTEDQLFVGVGTGIGGALVLEGQLYRGAFGMAAEIGHLRVVPDGMHCTCGQSGCWEQYASGSALTRAAKDAVAARDSRAEGLLAVAGSPEAVSGKTVTLAAQAGDDFAIDLLAQMGRWLGEGIASLCAVLDPGLIVLGGGVSEAGLLLLEPTYESLRTHLTAASHRPEADLRLARLGNDAGMVGAADLARR